MDRLTDKHGDAWDGILDPDEDIIWQGRPDGRLKIGGKSLFMLLFGCAFAGFALFWMIMASLAGGFFWMFGLIHFSVGVGIIWFATYGAAYRRRHTWYTLTNKRAFIATSLPLRGRNLASYPISKDTQITFEDGDLSSVFFASKTRRSKNGTYDVPIGFELLQDGRAVFQHIRAIQKDLP
ncbi:aspartate carbamoyltransferase catalytic subunit [Yoonia sp. 2307UL14-13]|uniref:aspartate carbamoyltransferase catalytic subunit n=1 Tax=Yoonia sp. 2307UL14-13 TaxID=3126506 RepID=UPI0030AA4E48